MSPEQREAVDRAAFDEAAQAEGVLVPSYAKRPGQTTRYAEAACDDCRDIGWVRKQVPLEHTDFGKLFSCECLADRHANRFMSVQAGENVVKQYTLAAFKVGLNPAMAEALEATKQFISGDAPPWLVIAGPYGIGKTHLAIAAGGEFIRHGFELARYQAPALFDALRAGYQGGAQQTYDDLMARLHDVDLLILDDLGMERRTEWETERIEQIMDSRYEHRMRTMITTNGTERISDRLFSRMGDATVCRLVVCSGATDVRPRLRQAPVAK